MAFFGGMPFPVQFFLAFVIVLGLIGATAWAVRRFGASALGRPNMRGRQPRLAVLEHTLVEGRRRLYLVRRDNVEHLLLIGGPTDIVVEPNIVRALPAQRDAGMTRAPSGIETLPRAIPLPESAGNGSWPLQPEVAIPTPPRAQRAESPQEEPVSWPLQPQSDGPRPQRETLAALADELSTRPAPGRNRPQASARPHAAEQRQPSVQYTAPETNADPDQNLAEMANRLEAALRKPNAKADGPAAAPAAPRIPIPSEHTPQADAAPPASASGRNARGGEARPRSEAKQGNAGKALYDSLEQEMASLLGRPAGKT